MKKFDYQKVKTIIQSYIHLTPVMSSTLLNESYGSNLLFKCENFQRTGSFKLRGALFAAISKLSHSDADTLSGHSSGNFAQALARTAQILDKKCVVIMPENAPAVKVNAVKNYGGQIIFSGNSPVEREEMMNDYLFNHPSTVFIHPSNDIDMIHGNASCAGELLEVHPELDHLLTPVGGGGLLAGTALAKAELSPQTKVYGAEPLGADDARKSFHTKTIVHSLNPNTIADGLRTQLGDKNFPIILKWVSDILTVSDREIIEAMKDIYRYLKIVIEPSSAVPLAVIKKHPDLFAGKNNGIILSGGNIDLRNLSQIFSES